MLNSEIQDIKAQAATPKEYAVVKRSVVIRHHKTSISLEEAFWDGLKEIAIRKGLTMSTLIEAIDSARKTNNLSSAVRLFVLEHYKMRSMNSMMIGEALPTARRA